MKYATASAFDRAMTDILQRRARETGVSYQHLRKEVAFDRVLSRLAKAAPDHFLLKGGVAIDYRMAGARSTKDIDLSTRGSLDEFTEILRQAINTDLGDYFAIAVIADPERPTEEVETYRFSLDVSLRLRTLLKTSNVLGTPVVPTPVIRKLRYITALRERAHDPDFKRRPTERTNYFRVAAKHKYRTGTQFFNGKAIQYLVIVPNVILVQPVAYRFYRLRRACAFAPVRKCNI